VWYHFVPCHTSKEFHCEEMVTDTASTESQSPVWVSLLGSLQGYFGVFHNLVVTVYFAYYADCFCWECFFNNLKEKINSCDSWGINLKILTFRNLSKAYLSPAICSLSITVSNEGWVGHFHENVINTINMNVFDSPSFHIVQDLLLSQSSVQSSVTI